MNENRGFFACFHRLGSATPRETFMREIQYQTNRNGGRSGHVLKDLFTSVILAKLLNAKVVRSPYWKVQKLISHGNVEQLLHQPNPDLEEFVFKRPKHFWNGISWEQFQEFRNYFLSLPAFCRVHIASVYRIHLFQIKNWEDQHKISAGMYDALIEDLRALYWGNQIPPAALNEVRKIVIHARRGDVASPRHPCFRSMGPGRWSATFYQNTIDSLRERYPQSVIRLLTEKHGSRDLDMIVGAEVDKGDHTNLATHFREMLTADLFVPTNSSLSTWATYLTAGWVATCPTRKIKQFGFHDPPANHIKLSDI